MGFVAWPMPPKLTGNLATTADSTIGALIPGGLYFHKTSSDKWSILRCYKSTGSVTLGMGLVRTANVTTTYELGSAATTDAYTHNFAGVAAAAVNNTGYFSFAYVYGYCPDIRGGSGAATGVLLGLSGSQAGVFGSAILVGSAHINSSTGLNAKSYFYPVILHTAIHADGGSSSSGVIKALLF